MQLGSDLHIWHNSLSPGKIESVYCLEKQWVTAKYKCRFGLKTQSRWCRTTSWQNKYPLCAWHFPHYKGSLCGSQGILKWLWEKCCIKSNFWDEGLNGFHHWRRNDRNLNYDLAIWENKKLPFWVRLMAFLPISRQGKGGQSRTLGSHINICDLLKNVDGSEMNLYFANNTKDPWPSHNRVEKR